MRGIKGLVFSAALLVAGLLLAPQAKAQFSVGINLGAPPACTWGYYPYAPYACAPYGYWGPGYFYNGIFLGVGPWAHWGYAHGWGEHRFVGASYRGAGFGYRGGYRAGFHGGYGAGFHGGYAAGRRAAAFHGGAGFHGAAARGGFGGGHPAFHGGGGFHGGGFHGGGRR